MPQLVKTGSNTMRIPWLFFLVYVRGRDRARLLRLAGASGVRFRIDWRTNAEHRIVRRRHTRRQRQRVEIDICGWAGFLRLDSIERQRANVHMLAVRRPADGGVVGGIARFSHDDDQKKAYRLPMDLRDEVMEQVILVRWGGASRLERLHRFQDPAHLSRLARRIREAERIQTVEGGVAESRPARFGGDHLEHLDRFRMALFECLHISGIGFSGRGVRLECEQALEKDLRRADREQGEVDHRSSPQFAVARRELKPKTTPGVRPVGLVRLPAIKRKPSNYWHAPRFKDGGLGEPDAVAIALEGSGNPKPLRVIPSEPGMEAVDLLESVGEPTGRQLVGAEPSAEVGERSSNRSEGEADQGQSCYNVLPTTRAMDFRGVQRFVESHGEFSLIKLCVAYSRLLRMRYTIAIRPGV